MGRRKKTPTNSKMFNVKKHNLKIRGVLHIGGHYGQEQGLYESLGVHDVVWFEPLKDNFEVLSQNIGDSGILINKALGNKTGKVEMNVSTNKGISSSVLQPTGLLKNYYPRIDFNEKEIVDMVRLDDVELDFEKYNLITIDVQGYELEVLKGATNTLKNIDYIVSEVNVKELYHKCVQIEELSSFLFKYGFELVDKNMTKYGWGDALFIKSPACDTL